MWQYPIIKAMKSGELREEEKMYSLDFATPDLANCGNLYRARS